MKRKPKPNSLAVAPTAPPDETLDAAAVHQVYVWILDGNSQHDIAESIASQWPGQPPAPLMLAAMNRIADSANASSDVIRGWCIEATRLLYAKAIAANELAIALKAIKQLHDFSGA